MKRLLSLLLTVLLLLSLLPAASASSTFPDVKMYDKEISYLTNLKIINGYDDGKFRPEEPIKRVQAVQMILREMGITNYSDAPNPGFTDVKPGDYGYGEIAKAVQLGIVGGKTASNGSKYFDKFGHLKRSQMAKILVEAYNLTGTYYKSFTDVTDKHWAVDYVDTLAANRITTGYDNGTFKPEDKLSRQHFAVFMARYLNDDFKPADDPLFAHFIHVGQGDSTLMITPKGKTILIDGGKSSVGDVVLSYLDSLGIQTIDLMVATHPDADHIGGLVKVLEEKEVKKVLDSGKSHTSQTYFDYLTLIDQKDIPFQVAKAGEMIDLDPSIDIKVLNSGEGYTDNNDASVVLKVSQDDFDYLLTGDAGIEAERNMVEKFDVEAEVLKVGHHGSNTSTSQLFLDEVNPTYGILSYGEDNSYGHPHSEVVNRLYDNNVEVITTLDNGVVTIYRENGTTFVGGEISQDPDPQPTPENIYISEVDLSGETVTISNGSNLGADISGWYLISEVGNQRYDFPEGSFIEAGNHITVLSGPDAYKALPYYHLWTKGYIWNNSGDAALLYNSQGELVDELR
ncbi:MBL fold metallo-hydrolase [Rossellomorea vietnamensis]|uniref:MBL fold metallo-hydrolase n=1 Tax=Rossellomorea vietnamensis TaxID=218284 RepID=A0A5D4MCL4_9BACI|nr:S-layer homology domain-containing protein [Rossellomorea vietnamensis]TYR99063.1 MBL fold metallo-hydrolase [Rossellomorea vietnamensis]